MQETIQEIIQALPISQEARDRLCSVPNLLDLPDDFWDHAKSLLDKLLQLKLEPDYLVAAYLFYLSPNGHSEETLDLCTSSQSRAHLEMLTELSLQKANLRKSAQVELFMRKLIASARDIQMLSSILALQLVKLESSKNLSSKKQLKRGKMALSLYAPLAERLGIFWIKAELEDTALRFVEPETYKDLKRKVAKKRAERSEMVTRVSKEIEDLMEEANIEHSVQGRYKRFFSIHQKLKKVNGDFDRIQDLIAFRVLVKTVDDCYEALSFVHDHWTPRKGRFKDYISKPKANGYSSLHTTVLDKNKGEPIEIQIRTFEMHEIAEFGIAAHWQYKRQSNLNQNEAELYNKLQQQVKGKQGETGIPSVDLLSRKIYVLSPTSDIVELPEGATAVDFAYAIHTKIGNTVIAAKVNGSIVKLDDPLSTGDQIDITTSPKQSPRKEWLKFVKSSKAKHKIRHAVRLEKREANKVDGQKILEKTFKTHHLNLNKVLKDGSLEKKASKLRNQSVEHILCSIGEGHLKAEQIVSWFVDEADIQTLKPAMAPRKKKRHPGSGKLEDAIVVDGLDQMLVRFAKCCEPKRGDPIQGFLTQGRGITVHREDCASLEKLNPLRLVNLSWESGENINSELV